MTNFFGQSIGRYAILEQLGEGGMATVYKARDMNLNRDVAVKTIRTEMFGSAILERILERFKREAQALAKLTHPNIVSILDYGEYQGAPYLVMPYLPGGTLKTRVKKPIPYLDAVRLLIPIAQALAHAHELGIIHRDVKPSNILITGTGEPMLSDFGIAKLLDTEETHELTGTGVGIGTPEYMAPEQGMGQVDERADIYALGIVFYELVTGQIPYRADTPMAMLKKREDPLPRPKTFTPTVPDSVEYVLIKVLARDPRNRYQTAHEFANALENLKAPRQARSFASWISLSVLGIGLCIAGIVLVITLAGWLTKGGGIAEVSPASTPAFTPITNATQTLTATAAPLFAFTPDFTPLPAETPQPQFDPANPEGFLNWWFHVIWAERDYETLWNYVSLEFRDRLNTNFSTFADNWGNIGNIEEPIAITFIRTDGQTKVYNVKYTTLSLNGAFPDRRNDNFHLYFNPKKGHWEFNKKMSHFPRQPLGRYHIFQQRDKSCREE